MPRVTFGQFNFTAGEVSPKCYGRVDVARYQNGAQSLENCLVQIHGGAMRRMGSKFIAESKTSADVSRLIPFVFSVDQAYMLEFGGGYIRVYEQSGGQVISGSSPYEIATLYTEDMLWELDYVQGADTMFLFHQDVPIYTLKRFAADNWSLQQAAFTTIPFDELGHSFNATITLSSAAIGTGVTATASASVFLASDVGRRITYQGGIAEVTGYTSGTQLTVSTLNAFPTTALPAQAWRLEGTPQTTLTASAKDPVGAAVNLTAGAAAFRSADVGRFIKINGGLIRVTTYTDSTHVSGIIEQELTGVTASPANAWSLKAPAWNAVDGYPRTGTLHEQRLIAAGSPRYPQTVWGSRSAEFYDFLMGDADDDAFAFVMPTTGQINPIRRMSTLNSIVALTYGGELTITGGVEKPLTPTNRQIKDPSIYGCNLVKPVRIGNELAFVQRAGRKVRAFSYKDVEQSYQSPDLTVLAEHITKSGVVDMAYQQESSASDTEESEYGGSILWCVLANGKIAALTLDREEGVIAWAPESTDGFYESVACIPNETGDEVWVIVRRTINGQAKRYIERFDTEYLTDCAIKGTSGPGASVWTGLDHLEGCEVVAKTGNTVHGTFTVSGGEIDIGDTVTEIEIGLPYTNRVKTLRPEVQAGDGTAQGNAKRTSEVALLFKDTIGCKVNDQELVMRKFDEDLLDTPPEPFSGFESIGTSGWQKDDSPIEIVQDQPLPFHLLAIVRKFTVNS